jgi:hypothetical protein
MVRGRCITGSCDVASLLRLSSLYLVIELAMANSTKAQNVKNMHDAIHISMALKYETRGVVPRNEMGSFT